MKELTAQKVIDILGLMPHPEEGGHFSETYRSGECVSLDSLSGRYSGERCHGTAIYYMLTPQTYSHMHMLQSDEVFHFYAGGPCEMVQLHPDGTGERLVLGPDIATGQRPQIVVPHGSWQGLRLLPGSDFCLMGCTVAAGFEFVDYSHGARADLVEKWPDFRDIVTTLTAE
jgi:predicted cupin superfamily sugar epimerase